MRLPVGIDLGNGAIKLRMGETRLLIPNVVSNGMTRADLLDGSKALDSLDVTITSDLVGGERRYFVGNLASYQGTRAKYMSPAEQKTSSIQSSVMYVTALAAAVLKRKGELGEPIGSHVEADLYAVSGISLVESLQKGVRKRFEEKLAGKHIVRFEPPSPWGGVEVTLNVQVRVFPEGFAAFLWMQNHIQSVQFVGDRVIGMAEIGELSTELPVFNGHSLNPSLCTGEQFGVGAVIEELLMDIREYTGIESAFRNGRLELEQFLESPKRTISLMGKTYDLTELIDKRLSKEAKRLYDLIIAKWKQVPTIEQFWIVGGGASLFERYIRAFAAEEGRMLYFASEPGIARWMNAEGMYLLAKQTIEAVVSHAQS